VNRVSANREDTSATDPTAEDWWLWWGDMRKMRWTSRRVNRMSLTEWRRELITKQTN